MNNASAFLMMDTGSPDFQRQLQEKVGVLFCLRGGCDGRKIRNMNLIPSFRNATTRSYEMFVGFWNKIFGKSCITFQKPTFIWGTGRSGTFLLYDILSLHPSLACFKQEGRSKKGIWGSLNWGEDVPSTFDRPQRVPQEGLGPLWKKAGFIFDGVGIRTRERLSEHVKKEVLRRYANLRKEVFHRHSQPFRILDKAPPYLLLIDVIDSVFPDSFHIFCVRDPRSVLNSLLRIYRFPEQGRGRG